MHSESPIEVSIYLRVQDEHGQWGIAVLEEDGDLAVRTGEIEPQGTYKDTRAEAAVAAFSAVLEASAGRPYALLDVPPGRLRLAIEDLVGSFPGVVLAAPSWEAPRHRTAVVEAIKAMPGHRPTKVREAAASLVLSTDASVNAKGLIAGLGFVVASEDGRVLSVGHTTEQLSRKGDSFTGELCAILEGIKHMAGRHRVPLPGEGTVTVQSDSMSALGLLEAVREGRATGATSAQCQVAAKILAATSRMPVQFCWVRGHAGHEANEAADRLAVLARRGEEFKIHPATRARMFADLRRDLVGKAAA